MSKRKIVLIDKKFQLRTVFTILGIKIIGVSILIAVVGIYALYQNKKISNIVEIEDNIVQVLSLPPEATAPPVEAQPSESEETQGQSQMSEASKKMSLQMAQNHDQNMRQLRKMIRINQLLMWGIILVVLVQGVILYFILVLHTHRIAGPIYVMKMYMRTIINGTFPDAMRPLRDKDLLKDFYSVFIDMVDALKDRYGESDTE